MVSTKPLTAYGLLQFKDMARVHAVDPKLIQRCKQFLLSRRDRKGRFTQKRLRLPPVGRDEERCGRATSCGRLVERAGEQ